ncbi:hypothetical protein [Pseudoclavibacter sp. AY1H1]|uniref:hypothetical protein n=1 Tax=Pseudoclavibacter sp. AY1H1 TaxID=2080584 RepID=UPI000CE7F12E|nr:hypothetical protein [Pseudoclavibacter sp. AY1H1]PPF38331.1 hypothetical protein C5E05_04785 [Pseudoclavibacter sp. AY1H1]
MPDIAQKGSFTASYLPSIPGYTDTFNRANGAPGNGWVGVSQNANPPMPMQIVSNRLAVVAGSGTPGNAMWLRESRAADAVVTITIGAVGDRSGSFVVRGVSFDDAIEVAWRLTSGDGRITVFRRGPANARTEIARGTAANAVLDGDVIVITFIGTTLQIVRNGTIVLTVDVPAPTGASTRHGFLAYATGAGGVTYDAIKLEEA